MSWNTQPKTARVEKAQALNGIYIYAPYNAEFIDALKAIVPAELRLWENDEKRWYVFESYAEKAIAIVKTYWPNLLDNRQARQQERQQRQWKASINVAPANDYAALYVTSDAPAEVIRAAYKALALLHHPDNGGNLTTMQKINGAFTSLKK